MRDACHVVFINFHAIGRSIWPIQQARGFYVFLETFLRFFKCIAHIAHVSRSFCYFDTACTLFIGVEAAARARPAFVRATIETLIRPLCTLTRATLKFRETAQRND